MRELIVVPNRILRQKCKPVEEVTGEVRELAQDMVDYMTDHQGDKLPPIGFSAPQLGEAVRLIAFKTSPHSPSSEIQVLINPEIVRAKGKRVIIEGCLSMPRKVFTVQRAKVVKIRGHTLDGKQKTFRAHDILAQVFEHEIDHLNGILVDKIGKLRKEPR